MTDTDEDDIVERGAAAGLLYWTGMAWSDATERQRTTWRGAVCAILDEVYGADEDHQRQGAVN